MTFLIKYFLIIIAYLLGSIPFALIVSKATKGIDIRDYGSKNMGATNVLRVLGVKYGLLTFALDAMKAGIIIFLFKIGVLDKDVHALGHPLVYGVVAIIGHVFPIFAKFKGGKAVACSAGIILAYSPLTFLGCVLGFIITLLTTKIVSISSMVAAILAVIISLFWHDLPFTIFVSIMAIIILLRHRDNIKRLIDGDEMETKPNCKKGNSSF